jgi:hypothetical protein
MDMRSLLNSLVVVALVFIPAVAARAVDVTFEVDMNVQVSLGNFNPATGTVSVRGVLNDWNCSTELFDDGEDGDAVAGDAVYSATVDQAAGTYAYKFNMNCVSGGDDGRWEEDPNRLYTVDVDPITVSRFFNDVTGTINAEITFEADMSVQILIGNFDSGTDAVNARGLFNGWGCDLLNDDGTDGDQIAGDDIYSKTVEIMDVQTGNHDYKWNINCDDCCWEAFNGNRQYTLDLGLPDRGDGFRELTVNRFYNDQTTAGDDYNISYSVDMSVQIELGSFNPLTDTVNLRGGANDWGCTAMTPSVGNDEIYEVTVQTNQLPEATVGHKFNINCDGVANDGIWENLDDRQVQLGESTDVTVGTVFFNNIDSATDNQDVEILFGVDMSVQIATGNFDPLVDNVNARGVFNDWGCLPMTPSLDNDEIYEVRLEVPDLAAGTYGYKFNINCADPGHEAGDNREYVIDASLTDTDENNFNEVNILRFFDDVTSEDILSEAVTAIISIDASPAFAALDAGNSIDPVQGSGNPITSREEVTGVGITGASATLGSFNWGAFVPAQFLSDDGTGFDAVAGDDIYTGAFVFQAGENREQIVKLSLNDSDNEAGFDENRTIDLVNGCEAAGGAAGGVDDAECRLPTFCFGSTNSDTSLPFGSVDGAFGCTVIPHFLRGDWDGSGIFDITDPLNTLNFLFLGAFPTTCDEAGDFDNSGVHDISDALTGLGHLFLGSFEPPPPGSLVCGPDPTEEIPAGTVGGFDQVPMPNVQMGCDDYICPALQ